MKCAAKHGQRKKSMRKRKLHTAQKRLDTGFNKIFLQNPHGCKPLACSGLVLDTYCRWEPQHSEEPLSYPALHHAPQSVCMAVEK